MTPESTIAASLSDAQTWQRIETAPRDGTPILIWQPNAGFGGRSQSHHMPRHLWGNKEISYGHDDPRLQWYDDARYAIGYWRPWGGWGNRNSSDVNPTHWMPLPAPPVRHLLKEGESSDG